MNSVTSWTSGGSPMTSATFGKSAHPCRGGWLRRAPDTRGSQKTLTPGYAPQAPPEPFPVVQVGESWKTYFPFDHHGPENRKFDPRRVDISTTNSARCTAAL